MIPSSVARPKGRLRRTDRGLRFDVDVVGRELEHNSAWVADADDLARLRPQTEDGRAAVRTSHNVGGKANTESRRVVP
jgi:hypothetical protein